VARRSSGSNFDLCLEGLAALVAEPTDSVYEVTAAIPASPPRHRVDMSTFIQSGTAVLDNFFWQALAGPQARFALGTGTARRMAPGFAPHIGFAVRQRPEFEVLAQHCEPGERFHVAGWDGAAPPGWRIESQSTLCRMVWDAASPSVDAGVETVRLGPSHLPQVLDLAERTRPGPFGRRTPELGEYFGCFASGRLVAMAGERLHAGGFREVSGVCTDPDFRGHGKAQALVRKLVRRQMERRVTPLLHVRLDNTGAHRLYVRMGFREFCRHTVRVVSYLG
jgi:ribosomal protein S18 acetylase RimI-like enzyme